MTTAEVFAQIKFRKVYNTSYKILINTGTLGYVNKIKTNKITYWEAQTGYDCLKFREKYPTRTKACLALCKLFTGEK